MIVGSLKHGRWERKLAHPAIAQALEYLSAADFSAMADGKHPIQGEEMYARIMTLSTKAASEQPAERHQSYIDVHYLLEGEETIGWLQDDGTASPVQAYDPEQDYALYGELANESLVKLTPGMLAVLFPEDLHRPCLTEDVPSRIRKVVIKIHLALLQV